jgi:sugar phosphate isomerase/epimerase
LSGFTDEASAKFSEQLHTCKVNGLQWIELRGLNGKNVSELTTKEAKELKKQMSDNHIFVSSIASSFGKIDLTEDFFPHLESFKHTIELAHIFEARYFRIFSFYLPENEKREAYYDTICERIGMFIENAEGIQLCHENEKNVYGRDEISCKKLYDEFGGKIKLIFDPANFIQSGSNIEKAFHILREAIEYFHVNDCLYDSLQYVPAGVGNGKIEWLIESFYNPDKEVFLSVEPHLKIFNGYVNLQKEDKLLSKYVYPTNKRAFAAAVSALKEVMNSVSYKQEANSKKGYDEWLQK